MDAVKALVECVPFYCHKKFTPEGEPKRLCAGYAVLVGRSANSQAPTEQPPNPLVQDKETNA